MILIIFAKRWRKRGHAGHSHAPEPQVHIPVDATHALRNRIERCFNKLKNSRRLATRYDKTMASYLGFVHIAAIRIWMRAFVNKT